jgi:two-component system chemotaxis response regulator CheY
MDTASSKDAAKKILLVGHCGPDSTYLKIATKAAIGNTNILHADSPESMQRLIGEGIDLILFNRELDYGFEPATGVEMVGKLKKQFPELKMMVVSNYPEVQAAAVAAGALPGFGKRELGSPRVKELFHDALLKNS